MGGLEGFELLKQGAEARIYKGIYLGRPTIAKERFLKKYRYPMLHNQLTKERTKNEARAIVRCKIAGIRTPTLFLVDFKRSIIFMEYFEHSTMVKDYLTTASAEHYEKVSVKIGEILGKMHNHNVIHGDLTTSNILLVNKSGKLDFDDTNNLDIILIDFGLGHVESTAEDKAVDLYVLERALTSTHAEGDEIFNSILKGYQTTNKKGAKGVLDKLKEVQSRGRKRTMVG